MEDTTPKTLRSFIPQKAKTTNLLCVDKLQDFDVFGI
jgi:hypothetical protein